MVQSRWALSNRSTVGLRMVGVVLIIRMNVNATGLGALLAPLVSDQFAQIPRWSFHYLVSLGLACLNTALLIGVFRFNNQNGMD